MEKYETIRNSVEEYLKNQGIDYGFDEEDGYFVTDFLLDDGTSLDFGIAVMSDAMVSYAMLPFEVPAPLFGKMTEYITRANYGLLSGNFEFDYVDGKIQYKTFFHISEEKPNEEELEALLLTPYTVIMRYIEGIKKLMDNPKINVQMLINKIEG